MAQMMFTGKPMRFLRELHEALKLDRPVTAITIDASVKDLPTATVKFFLKDAEQRKAVCEVIERYRLECPTDSDGTVPSS